MIVEHQGKVESAIVVLNPSESKRLIAKAVAKLPEVRAALENGTVLINLGTTCAFVAEEITGSAIDHKSDAAFGVISEGELNVNHPETNRGPLLIKHGKIVDMPQWKALRNFTPSDVYIEGANAVDPTGDVGILTASHDGGSIASAWYAIYGAGAKFICPVGLEKLVPSVAEASSSCNMHRFSYSTGVPVSLLRLSGAKVITEIEAIELLSGAKSFHVGSGGIAGSEGAVVLVIEGEEQTLDRAFELIVSVKGEPPVPAPRKYTSPRASVLDYDSAALSESTQFATRDPHIFRP